jgi:hypothetical protein
LQTGSFTLSAWSIWNKTMPASIGKSAEGYVGAGTDYVPHSATPENTQLSRRNAFDLVPVNF